MSSWWQGLSLREKLLIGAAGALAGFVLVWYGLVTPTLSARADARVERQQAADTLASLEHLVAASRAQSPAATGIATSTSASLAPGAFKAEVTRQAQQAGLSISRMQGRDDERFSLVFEQADARQFFYWLNQVETRLGGGIERLTMDQANDGRVRATVELSSGVG